MLNIPLQTKHAFDRDSLGSINKPSSLGVLSAQTISSINHQKPLQNGNLQNGNQQINNQQINNQPTNNQQAYTQQPIHNMTVPTLANPIPKGQKALLFQTGSPVNLSANFGWNTTNSQCDVDVSAFLLGENGKVIGDSWFVFYGQPTSPDQSITLSTEEQIDRQTIAIDFSRLNPNVQKIVFVLTINEAFEKNLNFGMMKDAYVRILNQNNQSELVSFKMTEYYDNVISMMIGEIYRYNDSWKFNAVGNGVTRDLAGLCELYGVEVV